VTQAVKEEQDNGVVGFVEVKIPITTKDIEDVIITAFEGGINYWAGLRLTADWTPKPLGLPNSEWAAKLIIEGKTVKLYDIEDKATDFELTLKGLLFGIQKYYLATNYQIDKENWDAESADCIIQYALFGEIVFG
jgi:hypothetical protein